MSTILMLAPTQQLLVQWQHEWRKTYTDTVESVNTPQGKVVMRGGDVYLWRVIGAHNLQGLQPDAVVVHKRLSLFTAQQLDELAQLRARLR